MAVEDDDVDVNETVWLLVGLSRTYFWNCLWGMNAVAQPTRNVQRDRGSNA